MGEWLEWDAHFTDSVSRNYIRAAFRRIARGLVGFGARDKPKGRRIAYQAIVGPGESARMRQDMLRMSGCGLVGACVWRCSGVRDARLAPPYKIGSAISRLEALADDAGAKVRASLELRPGVGDLMLVGRAKPVRPRDPAKLPQWQREVALWRDQWGGEAHVTIVAGVCKTSAITVNGGQRDATGQQCITESEDLPFFEKHGRLWFGFRRVSWWVDCCRLPFAAQWYLPVASIELES